MKISFAALAIVLMSSATASSKWTAKYEKEKLSELKSKIQPAKNSVPVKMHKADDLEGLKKLYSGVVKQKSQLQILKTETLKFKQKAVPLLIEVMKKESYPIENRWVATFMLGRIMGKKSSEFISKFADHKNWMMRLASLKVLLHLDQKKYLGIYSRRLEDKSLIVRHQALQNIRQMKLKKLGPYVWKMLYNKQNYVGLKGQRKRSNIIKDAIKTVGELNFDKAKKPMLKMMSKKKYRDVYSELDYALNQLSDKKSPDGSISKKQHFWKRMSLKEVTI